MVGQDNIATTMAAYPGLILDPYRPWARPRRLDRGSPLATAASVYAEVLAEDGVSPNTVSAFETDLRLFAEAVGGDLSISEIDETHVDRFRRFLTEDRDVPCSPASMRRRLTAVQSLFRHLQSEGLVDANPVTSIPTEASPARKPIGDLLGEEETEALMAAAGAEAEQDDWRPLLLVRLLLSTGISKAECLALYVDDIDPEEQSITVGTGDRRRSLPLDPEAVHAYRHYRDSHRGEGKLFDCTGRNLEYVLTRLGRAAGLSRNPSFRILRATAAARLQQDGADNAEMANQLGISRHTWPALRRRIRRAANQ